MFRHGSIYGGLVGEPAHVPSPTEYAGGSCFRPETDTAIGTARACALSPAKAPADLSRPPLSTNRSRSRVLEPHTCNGERHRQTLSGSQHPMWQNTHVYVCKYAAPREGVCTLRDAELLQFNPTTTLVPNTVPRDTLDPITSESQMVVSFTTRVQAQQTEIKRPHADTPRGSRSCCLFFYFYFVRGHFPVTRTQVEETMEFTLHLDLRGSRIRAENVGLGLDREWIQCHNDRCPLPTTFESRQDSGPSVNHEDSATGPLVGSSWTNLVKLLVRPLPAGVLYGQVQMSYEMSTHTLIGVESSGNNSEDKTLFLVSQTWTVSVGPRPTGVLSTLGAVYHTTTSHNMTRVRKYGNRHVCEAQSTCEAQSALAYHSVSSAMLSTTLTAKIRTNTNVSNKYSCTARRKRTGYFVFPNDLVIGLNCLWNNTTESVEYASAVVFGCIPSALHRAKSQCIAFPNKRRPNHSHTSTLEIGGEERCEGVPNKASLYIQSRVYLLNERMKARCASGGTISRECNLSDSKYARRCQEVLINFPDNPKASGESYLEHTQDVVKTENEPSVICCICDLNTLATSTRLVSSQLHIHASCAQCTHPVSPDVQGGN